jgi:hypothetical protein
VETARHREADPAHHLHARHRRFERRPAGSADRFADGERRGDGDTAGVDEMSVLSSWPPSRSAACKTARPKSSLDEARQLPMVSSMRAVAFATTGGGMSGRASPSTKRA